MELKHITDRDLLAQTKSLVERERRVLTQILHHLLEVERRKLYSDLGYESLFQYAVKELRYSEGAAGRRLQAMNALKENPEIEQKIEDGSLNLSNICQAQSYFREAQRVEPTICINSEEKLKVFASLENKSAREGQKELLKLQPDRPLPRERERLITETHTEVSFVLSQDLKNKLEDVRSLLGPKGAQMSLAELVEAMADLSLPALKAKRFGKKRVAQGLAPTSKPSLKSQSSEDRTKRGRNPRYISKATRYKVWLRDHGSCKKCGTKRNLNQDHVQPVALGGQSEEDNLRLLCFNCNQRQAIRSFGLRNREFSRRTPPSS